jgi:hypothetical protein
MAPRVTPASLATSSRRVRAYPLVEKTLSDALRID